MNIHQNLGSEQWEHFSEKGVGKRERGIIDDYIAHLMTREHRMADISYMAGVGDTVKFFNGIGLLKGSKNKGSYKARNMLDFKN